MLATTAMSGWAALAMAIAQEQGVTLDTVTVQGDSGGTDGYLATRSATATKTDTPLRDVPQAVSVVTKEQIEDIGGGSSH